MSTKAANKKRIKVSQTHSTIGVSAVQRSVLRGLGLRGIGSEKLLLSNPSIFGMIKKVKHLISIEEV